MINLGDEVKDKVSGFKGIAVAKHIYMQGCSRITVQPSINKDKTLPADQTFDEPLLLAVNVKKVKSVDTINNPGGPEKYADVRKY